MECQRGRADQRQWLAVQQLHLPGTTPVFHRDLSVGEHQVQLVGGESVQQAGHALGVEAESYPGVVSKGFDKAFDKVAGHGGQHTDAKVLIRRLHAASQQ